MQLLPKVVNVLGGFRDRSLADDLDMVYRDAAEVLWLIERLEGEG